MVHNNQIYDFPISLYQATNLRQLGLDWFMYLIKDQEERSDLFIFKDKYCLKMSTKVLKGAEVIKPQSPQKEEEIPEEMHEIQEQH